MNLIDALMGSLLFVLASLATAELHANSLRWLQNQTSLQEREAAIERALAVGNQELRSRAQASAAPPPLPSCSLYALELLPVLEARALALGLKPRLESSGERLLMVLETPGLPARQRSYVPAAYGLCQPEAT